MIVDQRGEDEIMKLVLRVLIFFLLNKTLMCQSWEVSLAEEYCVLMEVLEFVPSKAELELCEHLDGEGICSINGDVVFGTDWRMPRTRFGFLKLVVNNVDTISLDVSGLFNPTLIGEEPRNVFELQKTRIGLVLRGFFSDGAGSYFSEWLIIGSASLRTKVEYYE